MYFGAATSSYQVEGGIKHNDWTQAAREGKVPSAGVAADHYHRFADDFELARSLGHNAHRFSLEWARIEPVEGMFNETALEHYAQVLDALHERGLEPFVTLWHFTLPEWFSKQGGFEHPRAPEQFARYCEHVVRKLGSRAKFWITINEPMVYASQGYFRGIWPPFSKDIITFFKVLMALVRAHRRAYDAMKKVSVGLQIGIAKNNKAFAPRWLSGIVGWFWNRRFFQLIAKHQDFIGLNYYFVQGLMFRKLPRSDMGWRIYPEGLYQTIMELTRFGKPIYITENGLADAEDSRRAKFIEEHLTWMRRAITDGADVRGYFHWSLLDNFEWVDGFRPRFGLIEVDYATQARTIRPSAHAYELLIQKWR